MELCGLCDLLVQNSVFGSSCGWPRALFSFEERPFYPKNRKLLKRSPMPETKRYKQYEILRRPDGTQWELGSGAMGTTYKAFDTNLERAVALKIINDTFLGNDTARQQFLREARSAAGLRHPNIASVYDLGTDQDQYFYVMELIDGITVKEKVQRDGPFNLSDALGLIVQIASALSAAERQQLVHRDLKPANLMLTDENGDQVVKIIDFGLAKKILPAGEVSGAFTIAGGFVGTAEFASPEQIREADLDARSDIYSLGATLFFMLTGRPPFTGAAGEVMSHHLYKAIPLEPLSDQPSAAIELVQRMMEKDREKRPQNAAELRQLIESSLRQLSAPADLDRFRLVEPKEETPQGQWFRALDEHTRQPVEVFIFDRDLVSDAAFLATLRTQTELLGKAAHPLLRGILSLEETIEHTFLVEEVELGLSLQELLRKRQQLTPSEVAILLTRLASLADYAQDQGLSLLDLTLRGIRLSKSAATDNATPLLDLDSWKALELKVDPIDLSLIMSNLAGSAGAATWQGGVTLLNVASATGPRSSYLRLLSLLGYELMGGQRSQMERTGRMSPLSEINEEANLILRRGAVDEFGSATEMANAFKRTLETHFQQAAGHTGAILPQSAPSSRQVPPGQVSGSSTLPPISRPTKANQSTVTPPVVLPPPLPVTAFSTAGPGKNLPREAGRLRQVPQPANEAAKSIWQRPIILIGATLFLALGLGALACYLTIQQLVQIAADNGRQPQLVDKQETPVQKPVEQEKQQSSLARTLSAPGQYATIQSAIDAAKPGDTVLVKAGVFSEKLKFKDGIVLKGESRDTTIIRYAAPPTALVGESSYDAPLEIRNCKSGQVEQLSLEQTAADPRQATAGNNICRIDGVIVVNSSIVIKNCRATSAAACGIDVSGAGSAPTLIENQCNLSVFSGILFEDGAQGTAENNICEQNQADGIWVVGPGTAPNLTSNECRSNKREGIFFLRGARGRAEQNVCEQNVECGIGAFDPGTAPELVRNQCRSNRLHGIFFSHGAFGRAIENICESNGDSGIAIRAAMPFVSGNTLRGNSHYGLAYDTAAKPTFGVTNQISGNKLGEVIPNTVFK
jgi:parallel beta-helix repeat protein